MLKIETSTQPQKQYATLYADPPWPERGGGKIKRGADRHYPLMTVKEIINLPVVGLALPNAHLYLWATNNYLPNAFEVMRAWGFRYVTMITWAKLGNSGLGQYFRGATEHCLFGVKGQPPFRFTVSGKRAQGTTLIKLEEQEWPFTEVVEAPRGRHSAKPEQMRRMIETVSHPPYLELFAREPSPGWAVWGNEVDSEVALPVVGQGSLLP